MNMDDGLSDLSLRAESYSALSTSPSALSEGGRYCHLLNRFTSGGILP